MSFGNDTQLHLFPYRHVNFRRLLYSHVPVFLNGSNTLKLDLSHNRLISIRQGDLIGVINVIFLDLSRNQIKYIDQQSFATAVNLSILNLNNNFISTIGAALFNWNKFITEIHLLIII